MPSRKGWYLQGGFLNTTAVVLLIANVLLAVSDGAANRTERGDNNTKYGNGSFERGIFVHCFFLLVFPRCFRFPYNTRNIADESDKVEEKI